MPCPSHPPSLDHSWEVACFKIYLWTMRLV
jgi:hypothetical protein